MRRINEIITSGLTALSVVAWGWVLFQAWRTWSVPTVYIVFPIAVTACACVGWMLLTIAYVRGDGETRCRKCNHILRGLSEPRCPECGEPI